MSGTITRTRREEGGGERAERWFLIFALDADRPLAEPTRFALEGFDRVALGRVDGDAREVDPGGEQLVIGCPDRRMSGEHAELVRDGQRWKVRDLGSKNGVFVNGAPVEERALCDGDVLELGHSFFVVRQAVVGPSPAVVAPAERLDAPGGPATLNLALAERLDAAARVARSRAPILLFGESGTGKELLARALHHLSGRPGKLVAVNCAELPRDLVASELFGHRRGAFSGAREDREGLIAAADGGTLFLDEVGEIPEAVQTSLLRALQEREVRPVGATDPIAVDFRALAATHQNLEEAVAAGRFRGDLHARLSGFAIKLPPLRERIEDIGILLAELLPRIAGDRARSLRFSYVAARALLLHGWPANVRELENTLIAAVALAPGDAIELEHLPEIARPARPARLDGDELHARLEQLLRDHRGNVSAVARALGMSRVQIYRIARRIGVDVDSFR